MAKYQLMEKTENNGEVWYYILKEDGFSVNNSWTKIIGDAEKMFEEVMPETYKAWTVNGRICP